VEFCEYVNHPLFGACWDTGHANCEGHQYEDLIAMGDWLKAIHFNDNRGEKDEHLMPFNGTMSMDDIMHGLLDIGYKGYFTLECESTLKDGKGWPYKRRPSTRDTRLFDVPIEIIRLQEKVLYATAKYILEQYDCFEQ
jgi:sugar phosphate isomerase/epimerase